MTMLVIPFPEMHATIRTAFLRAGMNAPDADRCARVHTESTCDGVNSHGTNRVARFVDYLQRGWVDAHAKPTLAKQLRSIEVFDGHRGPGILNALHATERAMQLADSHGIGLVGLRNTTHWMRGGSYGWHAADRGYIALSWTNTESCMPAWGGKDPRLGNNPLVIAVPRAQGHLVLDMAMSQFSYGKLQTARLKGNRMPFSAGFDREGHLTDQPALIEASMRILPMGYWKGSGFAIMLDLLAAILSEGNSTDAVDQLKQGSGTGTSQVFLLIDPRKLGSDDLAERIANDVVEYVHASSLSEESKEVLYPGENALRTRQHQLAHGISVDDSIWAEILTLAGKP